MNRLILSVLVLMFSLLAKAGTIPEVHAKAMRKKPPAESLQIHFELQTEVPAPDPNVEDDPEKVAASFEIPEDAPKIAWKYAGLANATGGLFYPAYNRPLMQVLDDLLRTQLVKGADVVFVIDHTSSMKDDIEAIGNNIHQLTSTFEAIGGVRAGVVTFSDVKSGLKYGYHSHGLSDNYDGLAKFLGAVELLGSIEDIYGAIYKTIDEFKWKSKTKRLIVLISDDKPASGRDTKHSEEDVIAKCAQAGIDTHLYPVLVDKYSPVN
jgi:hypothetical protein